jgi:WD40 repeat protein
MANDFDKAALAWTLPWDADWVTAVTFLGPTRRVAAGNNLGQILVWDLPDQPGGPVPKPVRRLEGHTNVISRLLSSPDGRWLMSASYDHSIRCWDLRAPATGSDTVTLNARTREEASSPGGRRAGRKVPPADEARVTVQQASRVLNGHHEWVLGLAQGRDGALMVSGDDAGEVIVWDQPTGKELRRWKVKGWVYALALSPDAKQLAISERRPLVYDPARLEGVKLWDRATAAVQHDLAREFKGQYIAAAAYAPDGKLLALARGGETGGPEGKVTLIDPANGKKLRELSPGHLYGATDLVFHPDGRHLFSTGRDTVVRIWDTKDGKLVKELGKPRGGQFKDWFHALSLTPDGRVLAAADMVGAVQVWTLGG